MDIVVKGRNVEVPAHYRELVEEKLARLERYDRKTIRADVELFHERNPRQAKICQRVEITVKGRGPAARAEACAADFYAALDAATSKLENRLRRMHDRRKVHHGRHNPTSVAEATADPIGQPVPAGAATVSGTAAGAAPTETAPAETAPAEPVGAGTVAANAAETGIPASAAATAVVATNGASMAGAVGTSSPATRSSATHNSASHGLAPHNSSAMHSSTAVDRTSASGGPSTGAVGPGPGSWRGQTAVLEAPDETAQETAEVPQQRFAQHDGGGPGRIVREKEHTAQPMTVDQALSAMELVGHDFYLFCDADNGRPSVVYRRSGFDYGVIRLVD